MNTTEPATTGLLLSVVDPIFKPYMGRKVINKIVFDIKGTFESYYAAINWCKENGFNYGSMDGSNPIALWHDDSVISKWHNLSNKERKSCDGMIECQREGIATIILF